MEKKPLTALIIGIVLIGLFVIAVIFSVKKYEKESLPSLKPAGNPVRSERVPAQTQKIQEKVKFSDGTDNQFSTEKGKFLQ